MRFSTISKPALACCLFCLNFTVIPARAALPARQMADAANKWLASLTAEQRAQAVYEFKDEQRFDWNFVPKPRKGLPFKEMTTPQRALAHTLLTSGLSVRGLIKATNIMSLEYILFDLEAQSPTRDAGLYFVTIFGKPGPDPWGWRVEGHHLSLNFAVAGDHVLSVTPS